MFLSYVLLIMRGCIAADLQQYFNSVNTRRLANHANPHEPVKGEIPLWTIMPLLPPRSSADSLARIIHDFRSMKGLAMVQIRCLRGFETKSEAFA